MSNRWKFQRIKDNTQLRIYTCQQAANSLGGIPRGSLNAINTNY